MFSALTAMTYTRKLFCSPYPYIHRIYSIGSNINFFIEEVSTREQQNVWEFITDVSAWTVRERHQQQCSYVLVDRQNRVSHYDDVIMGAISSQITSLTIVYSTVYLDADQRKHQSSASLAFVRGIQRWPVNSPHKWPVMRKIFPFDDVIMRNRDRWMGIWVDKRQTVGQRNRLIDWLVDWLQNKCILIMTFLGSEWPI